MFLRRHLNPTLGLACLILAATKPALAAGGANDGARAAARAAGYDGIRAFESGDYATAVDKLDRAFGVVRVPTLGLWYARALVKTGKLVEASERYGEVARLEITEGKIKEQQKAQSEASSELAALQARIPTLTILVAGATEDSEVTLDETPVNLKLLGLATPANPGTHRIRVKRGPQQLEQAVTLAEGEKKRVELKFDTSESAAPNRVAGLAPEAEPTPRRAAINRPVRSADASRGRTQSTLGWISIGLGGAATVAGITTALLAKSKRDTLDSSGSCRGTDCLPVMDDTRSSYNTLRTTSTIGFVVGAVGLGAGTALLLTTPKPKEATVGAWVGIGALGLKGNF